jgi:hypothetical protein
MPKLDREDLDEIESLAQDVWNTVFHALDADHGGDVAGKVATAVERAFRESMRKQLSK